VSLEKYSKQYR